VTKSKGVSTLRHFRRHRGDEGAAAVEFALLFPIFMILAMGTIAVGTAFSRQLNVTQAAREASRYGATYDVTAAGGLASWLTAVDGAMCRAVNNGNACSSSQASNPLAGYDYRCVALITRNSAGAIDPARTASMQDGGSPVTGSTTVCGNTITVPNLGNSSRVVVTVLNRDVKFNILIASPTLHVDAVSTTPYEMRPVP
jgi:Flp pilus assembly protein TadG